MFQISAMKVSGFEVYYLQCSDLCSLSLHYVIFQSILIIFAEVTDIHLNYLQNKGKNIISKITLQNKLLLFYQTT